MKHLQECALYRIFLKVPQIVVGPVAGGHIYWHRIRYRFFVQLHLIRDLLPHVSGQYNLQKDKPWTYKVNIDVKVAGADGNIGELYGMIFVLQLHGSK